MSVCLFTCGGGSHMTITHDALDLIVQGTPPLPQTLDLTAQGPSLAPTPSWPWPPSGHGTLLYCTPPLPQTLDLTVQGRSLAPTPSWPWPPSGHWTLLYRDPLTVTSGGHHLRDLFKLFNFRIPQPVLTFGGY